MYLQVREQRRKVKTMERKSVRLFHFLVLILWIGVSLGLWRDIWGGGELRQERKFGAKYEMKLVKMDGDSW